MNLFLTRIPLFPIWPEQIEIDGVNIPLNKSPLSPQMRRRLMKGLYETAERELGRIFIRPGDQILEIGASIGIVTCILARSAGDHGRIVSVEPDVSLRPHFERQLDLNGIRVELLQVLCCPVWKQPVPETLRSRSFLPSMNNLSGRVVNANSADTETRWITAEEICFKTGLEPTAMVVDIEGTEAVWAEYSPNCPASLRTIIIEVHPHLIGVQQAGKVIQSVIQEGFRVAGIRNNVFAFQR